MEKKLNILYLNFNILYISIIGESKSFIAKANKIQIITSGVRTATKKFHHRFQTALMFYPIFNWDTTGKLFPENVGRVLAPVFY